MKRRKKVSNHVLSDKRWIVAGTSEGQPFKRAFLSLKSAERHVEALVSSRDTYAEKFLGLKPNIVLDELKEETYDVETNTWK